MDALLAIAAIGLALIFDFVNGFHDTANAVSTSIYTRALSPRVAIAMSGVLNALGALFVGTNVARFISQLVPLQAVSLSLIIAVLLAGLVWNLYTWFHGLPVSSSHCLLGSLFGAGIAAAGVAGINWMPLMKAGLALLLSPLVGFGAAAVVTWTIRHLPLSRGAVSRRDHGMRWLQVLSSACVSFTHGSNDGQKTMGLITLILATQFASAGYVLGSIPIWVIFASALAIGLGTTIGGWRVIHTVGSKISHAPLTVTEGFAAEASTAAIILSASVTGLPVSTTHTLSSAVAGGMSGSNGLGTLNLATVKKIILAWIFTLPVSALLSAALYLILRAICAWSS